MAAYMPSLTLPPLLFRQPALSTLFPLVLTGTVGLLVGPRDVNGKYEKLRHPPLRPPAWVFAPVWTVLYCLMGYGAYRSWTAGENSIDPRMTALAKQGATLYTIQLVLNQAFTPLFFRLGRPIEAMVDSVALTSTVYYLIYIWRQVDPVAAWCIVPYAGWLTFASYTTAGYGYMNDWSFAEAWGWKNGDGAGKEEK